MKASAVFFALWLGCVPALQAEWREVRLPEEQRDYWFYKPTSNQAAPPFPLVVALHGHGGEAHRMEALTGFSELAEAEGFAVAYPQGSGWMGWPPRSWDAHYCCGYAMRTEKDDVAFLRALLEDLDEDPALDTDRAYLAGVSNGGMLAYRVACEAPQLFSAIGVVAASYDFELCEAARPVPMIILHGIEDRIVPFEGGPSARDSRRTDLSASEAVNFWREVNGCGDVRYEVSDDGWAFARYGDCRSGAPVVRAFIEGERHHWPQADEDGETDAAEVLWSFFESHD